MSKRLRGKQTVAKRLRGKQPASAPPEEAAPEAIPAAKGAASKYDDVLRKIYYDVEEGFGSIDAVYKTAKKPDNSIARKS